MKTFKKVQKTTTVMEVESHICDLCKQPIVRGARFDASKCVVDMVTGNVFPEGDFTETTRFDVCVDCFEGKLMPLLQKEFGATPRVFMTEDGEAG